MAVQQPAFRDSPTGYEQPAWESRMIKSNNDALLGQQAQAETASEIEQSTDADADHREAIAGITKGLSEALAGRGVEARRFFQELQASRG
jgi:hypothetical protein